MRLSYKIIKNKDIAYSEERKTLTDIKLEGNFDELDEIIDEVKEEIEIEEVEVEEPIDIELIKKEIEEKFTLENEELRRELLANIELEARKKAEEEAAIAKQEAAEEGYKDGLKHGYQRGIQEAKGVCDEMKKTALDLIQQAKEEVEKYYSENKANIIRLAGDMAENIVNETIDLSSENILMLIKPIINLNERNELIVITCHPDKFEFLKKRKSELELAAPNARFVLLSDNNLEKNGCIIENENQIIDLQIRKQIESIVNDIRSMEE